MSRSRDPAGKASTDRRGTIEVGHAPRQRKAINRPTDWVAASKFLDVATQAELEAWAISVMDERERICEGTVFACVMDLLRGADPRRVFNDPTRPGPVKVKPQGPSFPSETEIAYINFVHDCKQRGMSRSESFQRAESHFHRSDRVIEKAWNKYRAWLKSFAPSQLDAASFNKRKVGKSNPKT